MSHDKKQTHSKKSLTYFFILLLLGIVCFLLLAYPVVAAHKHAGLKPWNRYAQESNEMEEPWGATSIIIETTEHDIELQVFVDGFLWKRLDVFTPDERRVLSLKAHKNFRRQGGLSELFFASEPTHYLEEEPEFDGTIASFLARFPEGDYIFEGRTISGGELEGLATLTHDIPALPEIITPLPVGEDPPVVDPDNAIIEWQPVTTQLLSDEPVDIVEYQVILDQVDPPRDEPWVDGTTRRALINLPPASTRLTVPPEFLIPGASYEFEILAIEVSGNSTISSGEFITAE